MPVVLLSKYLPPEVITHPGSLADKEIALALSFPFGEALQGVATCPRNERNLCFLVPCMHEKKRCICNTDTEAQLTICQLPAPDILNRGRHSRGAVQSKPLAKLQVWGQRSFGFQIDDERHPMARWVIIIFPLITAALQRQNSGWLQSLSKRRRWQLRAVRRVSKVQRGGHHLSGDTTSSPRYFSADVLQQPTSNRCQPTVAWHGAQTRTSVCRRHVSRRETMC